MENLLPREFDVPFLFEDRADCINPRHRPIWHIAMICLLLRYCCRQSQSSLKRLHLLSWSVRSKDEREALLQFLAQQFRSGQLVVRVDPAMLRAVNMGIGRSLLERIAGNRIRLTSKGQDLVDAVMEDSEVFLNEKQFLGQIGQSVTEKVTNAIFLAEV